MPKPYPKLNPTFEVTLRHMLAIRPLPKFAVKT
jgi:hypothetical protein